MHANYKTETSWIQFSVKDIWTLYTLKIVSPVSIFKPKNLDEWKWPEWVIFSCDTQKTKLALLICLPGLFTAWKQLIFKGKNKLIAKCNIMITWQLASKIIWHLWIGVWTWLIIFYKKLGLVRCAISHTSQTARTDIYTCFGNKGHSLTQL